MSDDGEKFVGPNCPACGYHLRGLTEHRCPECGRAFKPWSAELFGVPPNASPEHWAKAPLLLLAPGTLTLVLCAALSRIDSNFIALPCAGVGLFCGIALADFVTGKDRKGSRQIAFIVFSVLFAFLQTIACLGAAELATRWRG